MTLMSTTSFHFDLDLIKIDINWILEKYPFSQVGLKHSVNCLPENKILESVGSNYDFESKSYRFDERDFTEFNVEFRSTYLYEIHKQVPNIGRFRIMSMPGPSCYSIHRDQSKRYHIAVETNKNCLFLFPGLNTNFFIPADGNMYSLDTRQKHTFLNGSKTHRVHLVLDDISTLLNKPK